MMILSNWLSFNSYLPMWAIAIIAILLWWLLLWGFGRLLSNSKVRPERVIIQTRLILSWAGSLFLFNLLLVPVVLIAFHRIAWFILGACSFTAILYFIKVDDRDKGSIGDPF